MRIALVQSLDLQNGRILHSEINELIDTQSKPGDFWILPEAFDSGWNVTTETDFLGFGNLDFFREMSKKYRISICGSSYLKEKDRFFNRLFVVTDCGAEYFCDKRHLFGDFEKNYVAPGKTILSFSISNIKFRAIICYDLRFPVWCRNNDRYDALICVSQWPISRQFDRNLMLASRAMENVSYVLNSNALGSSSVYLPDGKCDFMMPSKSQVGFYELDANSISDFRLKRKYLIDSDDFEIKL